MNDADNGINEDSNGKHKNSQSVVIPHEISVGEKIFATVENEEYIKFKVLYERIVFKEKLTNREKNEKIIIMALSLLDERVSEIVAKGKTFTTKEEIMRR